MLTSLVLVTATVLLGGCSFLNRENNGNIDEAAGSEGEIVAPGTYDSEDTAIVLQKNTEESSIQLQNLSTGKQYTLSYDGATHIHDKNAQAISLEQLEVGSIVTAQFYKPKKLLTSITVDSQATHFDELTSYVLDTKKGTISIGETVYKLSSHLVILSQEKQVELMDINQVDVLSVWGYQNQIYSINIEQGHGYLRLQNDTYFVDGWIEVGQKVIRKITEDMLIVVPEGTETVKVSHNGSTATQEITFARNQEMAWDLGDVEITEIQKGTIIFTMEPAQAKVMIDGEKVDTTKPVEVEYGVHQLTVTADGYEALSQYIKVRQPSGNISLELEKADDIDEDKAKEQEEEAETEESSSKDSDEEESSVEASSEEKTSEQSSSATTAGTSGSYKVYIDSPEGAEVYVDGNYVGIAPVNIEKKTGNYVITLRKTGCQTRSYTVQIDDEEKDVNYSFAELVTLE